MNEFIAENTVKYYPYMNNGTTPIYNTRDIFTPLNYFRLTLSLLRNNFWSFMVGLLVVVGIILLLRV